VHALLPVPIRRLGYRFAYLGLRLWWLVRKPQVTGVKCVLTHGDRLLLVRHTYGDREWDLPGGSVKRNETPAAAARREMLEELGISVDDWVLVGRLAGRVHHRADDLHCFLAELSTSAITIDRVELEAASWFQPGELPAALARYVQPILSRAGLRAR